MGVTLGNMVTHKAGRPCYMSLGNCPGLRMHHAASLHPQRLPFVVLGRSAGCVACGDAPSITAETLADYDYAAFTGQAPNDGPPRPLRLLNPEQRITVQQLRDRLVLDSLGVAVPALGHGCPNPSTELVGLYLASGQSFPLRLFVLDSYLPN